MNCTALGTGIWKDFWDGFKHPSIFVSDGQLNTTEPASLQMPQGFHDCRHSGLQYQNRHI